LIGYLIVRAWVNYGHTDPSVTGKQDLSRKGTEGSKKVSKEIGEYVDYEEIKEKNS
jgi:hypothetical protein